MIRIGNDGRIYVSPILIGGLSVDSLSLRKVKQTFMPPLIQDPVMMRMMKKPQILGMKW